METGKGNGNGLVRIQSKSSVCSKAGGDWGRYILYDPARGLIVTEDQLERFGLVQTLGGKVLAREEVAQFVRYLVVWDVGSGRKAQYEAAITDADGNVIVPRSAETWNTYEKFLELWNTATRVIPLEPQLEFVERVRETRDTWTIETPILTVTGKRVDYLDRRYAAYEVRARIGGIADIVEKLYAVAARHGFAKGMYGGYIRRGPIGDDELKALKDEALSLLNAEKAVLLARWAEEVKARLASAREEVEAARRKLGVEKPASEPIAAEDIISLFIQRGEEETEEAEEVEEAEEAPAGELEFVPVAQASVERPFSSLLLQAEKEMEIAPPPPPTAVRREELVKLHLLAFSLPSRYAAARTKYLIEKEEGKSVLVERRVFEELASVIETARREAYDELRRAFAMVPELGVWIAVTDAAVEEARRVAEFVTEKILKGAAQKKLDLDAAKRVASRVRVEAWPIYLEPERARALLEKAIAKLSEDAEELRARIERAEKESMKKLLGKKLAEVEKLKMEFEKKLEALRG